MRSGGRALLGRRFFLTRPGVHQLIGEGAQPALLHQLRIQRAHRSGGRVARVGEERLSELLALAVDARERRLRQEDLAAHLDGVARAAVQLLRHAGNGADVDGDVLALHAVAARDAADQRAMLVGQGDAEAVDLQLRDIRELLIAGVQRAAQPLVERARIVLVVGVVEAEHRRGVAHDAKAGGEGAAADTLGRRIGRDEIGMRVLERLQLGEQRVELGVGDLGIVVAVVALFVVADLSAEFGDALGRRHDTDRADSTDRAR